MTVSDDGASTVSPPPPTGTRPKSRVTSTSTCCCSPAPTPQPALAMATTASAAAIGHRDALCDDEHRTIAAATARVVAVVCLVDGVDVEHVATGWQASRQQVAPVAAGADLEP